MQKLIDSYFAYIYFFITTYKMVHRDALLSLLASVSFYAYAVILLLGTERAAGNETDLSRPNILLILTDDQGYGDLSFYGNKYTETPCLEAFSKQAVLFRNFHAQPVCSPTRAELMTGRRFLEVGVWGVHGGRDYLNLEHSTIANYLTDHGYHSAMIGKWHLGKTAAYLPYNRGFEESWSSTDRLYEHTDPFFDHNGESIQIKGWTPEIITDLAVDYVSRERDKPFFLYVAYPEVHEPWYAPDSLVKKYQNKGLKLSLATVFAMNEHLDSSVGRLLDALDQQGLSESTVVVYVGDNGPIFATSNGLPNLTDEEMALRNPEELRGCKGNLYENGTRVPGMIRWPGKFEPREETNSVDVIDLVPTFLELAGIRSPNHDSLRGESLVPMLLGTNRSELKRPVVYANHETIWPERDRLYSYLHNKNQIDLKESHLAIRYGQYKIVQAWSRRELFDIVSDPKESNNLSERLPEVFNRMSTQLDEVFQEIYNTEGSYDQPTYLIGVPGGEKTLLYACAPKKVYGSVTTSSHSMDNIFLVGDGLEWELQVIKAGTYDFRLLFEPGQSQGEVQLQLNNFTKSLPINGDKDSISFGSFLLKEQNYKIQIRLSSNKDAEHSVINKLHGLEVALATD